LKKNNLSSVQIVTSWTYPHFGGVSSHIKTLASQLLIEDEAVLNFSHITRTLKKHNQWIPNRIKFYLRKFAGIQTISLYSEIMTRLLQETTAEIVHCHDAMATWAAIRARQKGNRNFKIISTVHGPVSRHMIEEGYSPNSPDVKMVEQCEMKSWPRCDAIIAVDKGQANILIEQGAEPSRLHIIFNSVDVAMVERIARKLMISNRSDRPWVLVPRRLTPKCGVEYAIRAIRLMRSKPLLILAGGGLQEQRLRELAKEEGVESEVVFLGEVPQSVLFPLIQAANCVLIPSVPVHGIEEATSISALESLALGRPVVASALGGLLEIIQDRCTGILVKPGDHAEIASVLDSLISNSELSNQLGENGRLRVVNDFSVKQWFDKIQAVYREVLSN